MWERGDFVCTGMVTSAFATHLRNENITEGKEHLSAGNPPCKQRVPRQPREQEPGTRVQLPGWTLHSKAGNVLLAKGGTRGCVRLPWCPWAQFIPGTIKMMGPIKGAWLCCYTVVIQAMQDEKKELNSMRQSECPFNHCCFELISLIVTL